MPISVLLSIKPRFAEAILDGVKAFEFRRLLFRKREVTRVIIYASSPVKKVVGEFTIDGVLSMEPEALWDATQYASGIDKAQFDEYFAGRSTGYALRVTEPQRYPEPLELTGVLGIRRPPQSFQYLTVGSLP